jgi:hypothetical protein
MGIHSLKTTLVLGTLVVANSSFALMVALRKRPATVLELHVGAAIDALLIGGIAHVFSPFLLAPGIAALSVKMYLSDPRMKPAVIAGFALTSVLGAYALELAGILPRTVSAEGGDLVLHSPAVTVTMPATGIALAFYSVSLIALSAVVAQRIGGAMRQALLTVELQAWHLRKLVGS